MARGDLIIDGDGRVIGVNPLGVFRPIFERFESFMNQLQQRTTNIVQGTNNAFSKFNESIFKESFGYAYAGYDETNKNFPEVMNNGKVPGDPYRNIINKSLKRYDAISTGVDVYEILSLPPGREQREKIGEFFGSRAGASILGASGAYFGPGGTFVGGAVGSYYGGKLGKYLGGQFIDEDFDNLMKLYSESSTRRAEADMALANGVSDITRKAWDSIKKSLVNSLDKYGESSARRAEADMALANGVSDITGKAWDSTKKSLVNSMNMYSESLVLQANGNTELTNYVFDQISKAWNSVKKSVVFSVEEYESSRNIETNVNNETKSILSSYVKNIWDFATGKRDNSSSIPQTDDNISSFFRKRNWFDFFTLFPGIIPPDIQIGTQDNSNSFRMVPSPEYNVAPGLNPGNNLLSPENTTISVNIPVGAVQMNVEEKPDFSQFAHDFGIMIAQRMQQAFENRA